jgi:hypothetical protein
MRHDNKPGIAGVLTTRAECKVFAGWLHDPTREGYVDLSPGSIGVRFLRQTYSQPRPLPTLSGAVYAPQWELKAHPKFPFTAEDIPAIQDSAERILEQTAKRDRIKNLFSGRHHAARTMLLFLEVMAAENAPPMSNRGA